VNTNMKRRIDILEKTSSPSKPRSIHSYSDAELKNIILAQYKGTGKDGRPLTAEDLTIEKLKEIVMEERNSRKADGTD
jgi:hypothetical protein